MGLRSVLENIRTRGLRDILDPIKRKVFIKDWLEDNWGWKILEGSEWEEISKKLEGGTEVSGSAKVISKKELPAYCEQFVYRSLSCGECVLSGKCVHCKCPVPANMISAENKCSSGKWGPMLSTEDWNAKKLEERFYFKLENY